MSRSIWITVGIWLGLAACGTDDAKPPPPPSTPDLAASPVRPPAAAPDARAPVAIRPIEIDTSDPATWHVQDYDSWTILAPYRADAKAVFDTANQYVFADAMLVQDTRMPGQPTDLSWTLAEAADGAMPKRAKIVSEQVVTLTGTGIQGLDRTWKGKIEGLGSIKGRVRVFVRDAHLFQIEVLYTKGTRADALDRFIESFAINP